MIKNFKELLSLIKFGYIAVLAFVHTVVDDTAVGIARDRKAKADKEKQKQIKKNKDFT